MAPSKRTKNTSDDADDAGGVDAKPILTEKARQKLRGRRGGLEMMPRVSLDIIVEVLSHLHPRDILSLARTSKSFRALLLDRKHAFIWKVARKALPGGLPDPHPVLSEPALANLMFNTQCHDCGRGPVLKVVWLWFKRYCSKCLRKMSWATRDVKARMDAIGLGRVQDSDFRAIFKSVSPGQSHYCHAAQVKDFETRWHDAGDALDALTALYEERKTQVPAEDKLAAQLEEWSREDRVRRETENEEAREDRFADVLRRLGEAGWRPELEFYRTRIRFDRQGPARDLCTRRIAPKLVDKAWPKVHDSLKDFMADLRLKRLLKQHDTLQAIDAAIAKHYDFPALAGGSCPTIKSKPTTLDIAWMSESEDLFLFAYNASDAAAVAFRISQLVVIWEERLKDNLREQLSVLCPDVPTGSDPLELAIAVFGCANCESAGSEDAKAPLALRYPDILAHECFREDDKWRTCDDWPLPITNEFQHSLIDLERSTPCPRCPLVPERISIASAERACASLVQVNCDPSLVTFYEVQTWTRRGGLLIPPSADTGDQSLPENNSSQDADWIFESRWDDSDWDSEL